MENKLVHCYKCGKILFRVREEEEFNLETRCGKCGSDQRIIALITHKIIVEPIQKEEKKLSTLTA